MMNRAKIPALLVVPFTLTILCSAREREIRGRIVAYDPWPHFAKMASFVENTEVVILQLEGKPRPEYVKLVLHGFSQSQIPNSYFLGSEILNVRSVRDSKCDQKLVKIVANALDEAHARTLSDGSEQIPVNEGFVLSEHFKDRGLDHLSRLKCYSSTTKADH